MVERDWTKRFAVRENSGETGPEAVRGPLLVVIVSEGPHCVPCEYAIAAVEYVSEWYVGRIAVRIIETKYGPDALRYIELCQAYGGPLPIPAILFNGRLVFDEIPGPDELRSALDEALLDWEKDP